MVLWFGLEKLKLNRIYARHLVSKTASARVLRKVGMKREGLLREFARKEDGFEDAVIRATLRREWGKETTGPRTTDHRTHAFRI